MATVADRNLGGRPRMSEPCMLGKFIEAAMSRRGMNLEQLAQRSGIAARTLYHVINGETPDPRNSTIAALADALQIPAGRLVKVAVESSRASASRTRRTA